MSKFTLPLGVLIITILIGTISIAQIVMGSNYDNTSGADITIKSLFDGKMMDVPSYDFISKNELHFGLYL